MPTPRRPQFDQTLSGTFAEDKMDAGVPSDEPVPGLDTEDPDEK